MPSGRTGTIAGMDRALLAELLGEGLSLAQIGRRLDRHESTVAYWVRKHGLAPANAEKHESRGAVARETLERLVITRRSVREIATEVDRSPGTVRHWLRRHGLCTGQAARLLAYKDQQRRLVLRCPRHGSTEFQRRSSGGYRCLKCQAEAVTSRRRRVKQLLVEEAGGACALCGYDRCIAALHFHHLDPAQKRFALSHRGVSRSLAKARREAQKCVLLCGNCHAEVEAGMRTLRSATGS